MEERVDVMTDYQFKAILKMVYDILDSNNDVTKTKKSLKVLIGETFKDNEKTSDDEKK